MKPGEILRPRHAYHSAVFRDVLPIDGDGVPNNSDRSSRSSRHLGVGIVEKTGLEAVVGSISGQTAGLEFEKATSDFLQSSFAALQHLRPGEWRFVLGGRIQEFAQYRHLAEIGPLIERHKELRTVFDDYIVRPDIVVGREPVSDEVINEAATLVGDPGTAECTPLRKQNSGARIMHASVSCKWTIRSDRSQNARTEALNLMRNRKGKSPHIAVVTAEPLPSRIASIALGTGDIDCAYHFALPELRSAAQQIGSESDRDLLDTMVAGNRLRDISDLPFDLAT